MAAYNALDNELGELREAFQKSTQGLGSMNFEQCLTFGEISRRLSKRITTKEQLREIWSRITTESSTPKEIDFEVCCCCRAALSYPRI